MKKVLILVLILALAVALAACGKKDAGNEGELPTTEETKSETVTAEEPDLLARIKERGSIIVAMEGAWMPWTYHNEADELVGFDVEVSNAIAAKLGVTVQFEECPWDSIFGGLESGRYDMAVNGIDWTAERAENYRLSEPYTFNHTVLMVRGDNEDITCFEDLKGKKTANTISSTYAALTESYGATTTAVDDLEQTIELVLMGRVDATANAEVSYIDYMRERPETDIKVVDRTVEADRVCIAVRNGEDCASLIEAVNTAISELRFEGVLAELSIKYFGSDLTALPEEAAE